MVDLSVEDHTYPIALEEQHVVKRLRTVEQRFRDFVLECRRWYNGAKENNEVMFKEYWTFAESLRAQLPNESPTTAGEVTFDIIGVGSLLQSAYKWVSGGDTLQWREHRWQSTRIGGNNKKVRKVDAKDTNERIVYENSVSVSDSYVHGKEDHIKLMHRAAESVARYIAGDRFVLTLQLKSEHDGQRIPVAIRAGVCGLGDRSPYCWLKLFELPIPVSVRTANLKPTQWGEACIHVLALLRLINLVKDTVGVDDVEAKTAAISLTSSWSSATKQQHSSDAVQRAHRMIRNLGPTPGKAGRLTKGKQTPVLDLRQIASTRHSVVYEGLDRGVPVVVKRGLQLDVALQEASVLMQLAGVRGVVNLSRMIVDDMCVSLVLPRLEVPVTSFSDDFELLSATCFLLRTLDAAHGLGIAHCDFKPDCLWRRASGAGLVVIDWNCACPSDVVFSGFNLPGTGGFVLS